MTNREKLNKTLLELSNELIVKALVRRLDHCQLCPAHQYCLESYNADTWNCKETLLAWLKEEKDDQQSEA